jgi:hypothetical protein
MDAIKALNRITACSRLPFVAARCIIVKVITASALHHITPHRRHVSYLAGSTIENSLGEHWKSLTHRLMIGNLRIFHTRSDSDATIFKVFDVIAQLCNVHQHSGLLDIFTH